MRRKSPRSTSREPRGYQRGVRKLFGFLFCMACAAFILGFIAFTHHIDGLRKPDVVPKADGIVVWTGHGSGRLDTAIALLRQERGERLLISGVNESVDMASIIEVTGVSKALAECCIDLDYAALDTRGNAVETAVWARSLDYDHILLVTSSYHMPRARVEIGHEIGRIQITPVPVERSNPPKWWNNRERFTDLATEYGKFLLAVARGREKKDDDGVLVLPNDLPQPAEPNSSRALPSQ